MAITLVISSTCHIFPIETKGLFSFASHPLLKWHIVREMFPLYEATSFKTAPPPQLHAAASHTLYYCLLHCT